MVAADTHRERLLRLPIKGVSVTDEPLEMDEEFEEISAVEVDRVIAALDALIQTIESDTIRSYLETTAEEISFLVDDEEDEPAAPEAEAA